MPAPDDPHDPFIPQEQTASYARENESMVPGSVLPVAAENRVWKGGLRPQMSLRLVLMSLSAAGVVIGLGLLASGHGWLAGRLIAGDVLLIFLLLLVV